MVGPFTSPDKSRPRPRLSRAVGGMALTLSCAVGACRPAAGPPRTVVLVSIDTLRADHVGAYGDGQAETPALDAIAREGLVFDAAWSPVPLTLPAHASMLSGRYPPRHGVRANGVHRLAGTVPLVAESFARGGFRSAAVVGGYPLDARFGLARGFDLYDDRMPASSAGAHYPERRGAEVADKAIAWLQQQGTDGRVFLFVHFYDPHADYDPPPPYAARFAARPYDGEIAYVDAQVGRLRSALEAQGRWRDAVVLVVSDHGEGLGEHGEDTHAMLLYEPTLRVPLFVRAPAVRPGRAREAVSIVDVAPTLLALSGLPPLPDADGVRLVGRRDPQRALYAETLGPLLDHGWSGLRALRRGRWKLVDAASPELFDLAADPGERRDLWPTAAEGPELRQELRSVTARWGQAPASVERLDPAAREALNSLGYASGSAEVPADFGFGRPDPRTRMDVVRELDAVSSLADPHEALPRLSVLARRAPESNLVRRRQAALLMATGEFEAAADAYEEADRLGYRGEDLAAAIAEACRRAGEARAGRGNLSMARELLGRAARLAPDRADVAHALGVVEARAGRLAPALASFDRATSLDPGFAAAWFSKGLALERLGRRAEARAAYARFLALGPSASPEREHAHAYGGGEEALWPRN